jgi:TonB family protein
MHESRSTPKPSDAVGHLSVHLDPQRPQEIAFLFENPRQRIPGALGFSTGFHVAAFLLALFLPTWLPDPHPQASEEVWKPTPGIVWLSQPGPGGGGGGGGNRSPEPIKKAELVGRDKLTVPVAKIPDPQPQTKEPEDIKPVQELNIPAKSMASAQQTLPGAIEGASSLITSSQGTGSGGGAGTGTGTGIGPGTGSGLGPGFGGGTGGGAYRPGSGIELPRPIREEKPAYTPDAMRAKIQGTVLLECVVNPDGSVGNIEVKHSLDRVFGLDEEAVRAARKWRFIPGRRLGEPVAVIVTIELTFTLR